MSEDGHIFPTFSKLKMSEDASAMTSARGFMHSNNVILLSSGPTLSCFRFFPVLQSRGGELALAIPRKRARTSLLMLFPTLSQLESSCPLPRFTFLMHSSHRDASLIQSLLGSFPNEYKIKYFMWIYRGILKFPSIPLQNTMCSATLLLLTGSRVAPVLFSLCTYYLLFRLPKCYCLEKLS